MYFICIVIVYHCTFLVLYIIRVYCTYMPSLSRTRTLSLLLYRAFCCCFASWTLGIAFLLLTLAFHNTGHFWHPMIQQLSCNKYAKKRGQRKRIDRWSQQMRSSTRPIFFLLSRPCGISLQMPVRVPPMPPCNQVLSQHQGCSD